MKKGFSLVEVIIAMIFFALVLLGFLNVASSANRQSMDAYYEFTAMQAALEPLEIFRAAGFDLVAEYAKHPLPEYPLGWNELRDRPGAAMQHPIEWEMFQREIVIDPPQPLPTTPNRRSVRIRVRVQPRQASRAAAWLSRDGVTVESLIVELPR
ncbi:MAG: hypothetical protein WA705_13530 [Candidatus Ozemobacteraceae bacterium]